MGISNAFVSQLGEALTTQQPLAEDALTGFGAGASTVKFNAVQFSPVVSAAHAEVLAIDGGSAELFSSPALSLQLLRFAAVRMRQGKCLRFREEWLLQLRRAEQGYTAEVSPQQGSLAFPVPALHFADDEQALLDGGLRGNIGRLGNVVRKLGELQLAHAMLTQCGAGSVVLLDGNLQATNAEVERTLRDLVQGAQQQGIAVVGFAKTADLFTLQGRTATLAMAELAKQRGMADCWITSPLAEFRTALDVQLRFAKLHPHATYVFRLDVLAAQQQLLDTALAQIAATCSDPVFFGYPYPLIAADQLARISHEEQQQLGMQLIAQAGENYPTLRAAAHALEAHAVLDAIR